MQSIRRGCLPPERHWCLHLVRCWVFADLWSVSFKRGCSSRSSILYNISQSGQRIDTYIINFWIPASIWLTNRWLFFQVNSMIPDIHSGFLIDFGGSGRVLSSYYCSDIWHLAWISLSRGLIGSLTTQKDWENECFDVDWIVLLKILW